MEEDDDDFYGGPGGDTRHIADEDAPLKDEQMNDAIHEDGDEEDEEEDDDDDVEFTLEKPEGAKTEPSKPTTRSQDTPAAAEPKAAVKSETPVKQETPARPGSTAPPTAVKGVLVYDGKEGKDFPEIRTSKVDVDGNPIWPGNNKPIIEMDIDADLVEHSKPWRITGTDQTDYFNYGFDEYTWTMYCMKQRNVRTQIEQSKEEEEKMKAALGAMGGGSGGMPPMDMMGGMPDPQAMAQMMAMFGPMDPSQMPPFGNNAGGGFPAPPNMGNFGSGKNSASPAPGAGQGFQPPSGPGGHGGNMEGYSQQQIALMQGMDGGGGGRGRGRGRRGRGYY